MTSADRQALIQELPEIAEVVNRFKSEAIQVRVFDLLVEGLGGDPPADSKGRTKSSQHSTPKSTNGGTSGRTSEGPASSAKKTRRSTSPSQVKDLDLHPDGEVSFSDFADEKAPRYANEQSLVAALWLRDHGSVESITVDHIYTAFRDKGWKVPANLGNHLQVVASKKGWLDTGDMGNIRVTIQGENHVLHNLPAGKGT